MEDLCDDDDEEEEEEEDDPAKEWNIIGDWVKKNPFFMFEGETVGFHFGLSPISNFVF